MPAISTADLKSMIERNDDVLIINTLPSENFDDTRIPQAVNIPQDQDGFAERVEEAAGSKDKKIVVYCANLDCDSSTKAAKKLDEAGFTNVYDYRGGAKAWQQGDVEETAPSH